MDTVNLIAPADLHVPALDRRHVAAGEVVAVPVALAEQLVMQGWAHAAADTATGDQPAKPARTRTRRSDP